MLSLNRIQKSYPIYKTKGLKERKEKGGKELRPSLFRKWLAAIRIFFFTQMHYFFLPFFAHVEILIMFSNLISCLGDYCQDLAFLSTKGQKPI